MRFQLDPLASSGISVVQTTIVSNSSSSSSSGGASTFTDLTDTPVAITADQFVKGNAGGTALEFGSIPGGGDMLAANNLSDLVDDPTARTNLGVDAAGTDNSDDNAANTLYANDYRLANFVSGTDYEPAKGVDDNFVTDAEKIVIGNTSGTNTGDQTVPVSGVDFDPVGTDNSTNVTVADTAEIDLTITGQLLSAAIVASSIDETKLDASTNASLNLADSSSQATGVENNADVTDEANVSATASVIANTAKVTYPSADSTKVAHISVTQAVNLDTIESDTATNNAKVSYTDAAAVSLNTAKVTNANHSGDATGDTALTLATVNANVGSYTNADLTVNAKGLITAASSGSGGSGDVVGPGSSVDNAITRYDSTTGKLIQDSGLTLSDLATDRYTIATQNVNHNLTIDSAGLTLDASDGISVPSSNGMSIDNIFEYTSSSGVTIDSVLLKDGLVDGIDIATDVAANTSKLTADTTNVTAAGALMDSEVDADIKTLVLPASTTISTTGASLIDDASTTAMRTTMGVDAAGTDNSDDNAVNTLYSGLVTNATHTGDVTGATALTIAADAVETAMIEDNAVTDAKRPRLEACFLKLASNYNVAKTTWTAVPFTSEITDPQGWHSNSTNTSRITVDDAGLYQVTVHAAFAASTSTSIIVRVRINAGEDTNTLANYGDGSSFSDTNSLSYPLILAAGDFVEMYVYQNSAVTVALSSAASYSGNTTFRLVKLSD